MLKCLAIAALIALSGAGVAQAQDQKGAALVEALFSRAEAELLDGARPAAQARGMLDALATADHSFRLEAGKTYFAIGMCDENCSDLDMAVGDASGTSLGSDVETDDTPLVAFQAASSGNYTVRIAMTACASRCNYGVRVYEQ